MPDGAPGTQPAREHRGAALALSLVFGLLGWAYVVVGPLVPALGVAPAARTSVLPLLIFGVVILAIRAMAVRMLRHVVLSMDSTFYVGASLCLGALAASRMIAIAMTLDALTRFVLARRRRDPEASDAPMSIAYVLFFGGSSGGLLLACSQLFAVDGVMSRAVSHADIATEVVAVAATFLLSHYALQTLRSVLRGREVRAYLRAVALPGLLGEAAVMPIGILIVLVYRPDELLGFELLCCTYLVLHYVFSRLRRTSLTLQQRVRDLETLNASGRQLASSLELGTVVDAVATELPRAVPGAAWVALVHRGHERDTERFVVDRFDRSTGQFVRGVADREAGAVGWVVSNERSLCIDDLGREPGRGPGDTAPAAARAWLGVPIFVDNRIEGALVVAGPKAGAFEEDAQRVVEGMALQVAAAIQNAHLYEMAMIDGLTGLFVRRYLDARIAEELERARRYGTAFSIVMMDIDNFKLLNDTHGHLAGDRVLREVATVVRDQMRGVDTAARYGGEEFAVVLPRTEKLAAYNLAERIRAAIADRQVALDAGSVATVAVTASFGIASFPDEADTGGGDDIVRRADLALYRAKQLGKNRVELYWSDGAAPPGRPATAGGRLRRPSSAALRPSSVPGGTEDDG